MQKTTSAILGLSSGKFLLLSGVLIIGTIVFFKLKHTNNDIADIENLSTDDEKYKRNVWKIDDAIERNDLVALKELLKNSTIQKHNDLMAKIEDFLKKNHSSK